VKQLISVFLQVGDDWEDVTSDVYSREDIRATRGNGDEGSSQRPSSGTLTFDNRDDRYRPTNPESDLYGLVGRNTQVMPAFVVAREGFEDATLDITITSGSSPNPWARTSTQAHTGSWSLKSGTTAAGSFSDAIIAAPAGSTMCTLWYRVSTAAGDNLRISTGGVLRLATSGIIGWTRITVPVVTSATGAREVFVRYLKDASGVAGDDAVYIDDVTFFNARNVLEAASWEPDQSSSFDGTKGDAWTDLEGNGLLRRLGEWKDPLRSTIYRSTTGFTTLTGYWPLEDSRDATQATNVLAGGIPASVVDVDFAQDERPGGSDVQVKLGTLGSIYGIFAASGSATQGWQVTLNFRLAALPASGTSLPLFSWKTSDGTRWAILANNATYTLTATSGAGAALLTDLTLYGTGAAPDQWLRMRVTCSISGGTVSYAMAWYPEGATVTYGLSGTFASSTLGTLASWSIAANAHTINGWFGHVFGLRGTADNLISGDQVNVFNGYPGETAGNRFARLMRENGLAYDLRGLGSLTEPMGPQPIATLIEILQECADTDDGMLYDSRHEIGLTFRTRIRRYGQPVALALTFPGDIAPPMREVIDNQSTANDISVSQRDGGEAFATETTGPLSVQPPPAGVGRYVKTIDVNVYTENRLPDLAAWHLNRGTVDDPRYPSVTLDLVATPSLAAAASQVDIGERITVTGRTPDLLDMYVIGISEVVGPHTRKITFTCRPNRQFQVASYDLTTRRATSASSTLAEAITLTETIWDITTADRGDVWSTTSLPYDWMVGGERVTVTSMTAATGTGPYLQQAVVTRSVNGIVKTHSTGDVLTMHQQAQARYAL